MHVLIACLTETFLTIFEKVYKVLHYRSLHRVKIMLRSGGNSRVVRTTCEYSGQF